MPFTDTIVTIFAADTTGIRKALDDIEQRTKGVIGSMTKLQQSGKNVFRPAQQAAQQAQAQFGRTSQSVSSLTAQTKELERHTGQLTSSFRRAAMSVQTGNLAFDMLSATLDRASMMMWRFSIAAIPLRNIAFQATAVAGAFGMIGYKMAQAGAWMEVTRRQFISLYESQGKSRRESEEMLDWLRAQAPKLPATLQQIVEAGRLLTTQGFNVKELLLPLSDLTTGLNQAGIDIVSATRAMVDATHGEFRRLKNTFNIGREDVSKFGDDLFDAQGRVLDRNKVLVAVVKSIAEKYPKATEAAMGGLALAISNLQDVMWQFFAAVGKTVAPVLTKWIDRISGVTEWLRKLAASPFWSKLIGWSVILTTLGAGFVALGGFIAWIGLQFVGLIASVKVFFHMYSKENRDLLIQEQKMKQLSESLGQIRAQALLKEMPLLQLRLQLIQQMTREELALMEIGKMRAMGVASGPKYAAAVAEQQAASAAGKTLTGKVQTLQDVYHLPQLVARSAELSGATPAEIKALKIQRNIMLGQKEIATPELAEKLDVKVARQEAAISRMVRDRRELLGLNRRIAAVHNADVIALEKEAVLVDKQRMSLGALYTLERARRAEIEAAAAAEARLRAMRAGQKLNVPPGVAKGLNVFGPQLTLWGATGGDSGRIMEQQSRGLWQKISNAFMTPLQKAGDGIRAFGQYARMTALATWTAIRPMVIQMGLMALQMLGWSLAFAAVGLAAAALKRSLDSAADAARKSADKTAELADWMSKLTTIPRAEWEDKASQEAKNASDAWAEVVKTPGKTGEILREKLGAGAAIIEIQTAADELQRNPDIIRRSAEARARAEIGGPISPMEGSNEQARGAALAKRSLEIEAELRQGILDLKKRDFDIEGLRNLRGESGLSSLIAEVRQRQLDNAELEKAQGYLATTKEQNAASLNYVRLRVDAMTRERHLIQTNAKLTIEQKKAALSATDEEYKRLKALQLSKEPAQELLKYLDAQRTVAIQAADEWEKSFDKRIENGEEFNTVSAEASVELANQRKALSAIAVVDQKIAEIFGPKIAANRAKQRRELEQTVILEERILSLKIEQERYRRLGEVAGVLGAAGAKSIPALIEAQIASLQQQGQERMATGRPEDVKVAWDIYKQILDLRAQKENALIANEERSINLMEDGVQKEAALRDVGLKKAAAENRRYADQRAALDAEIARGYIDQQTASKVAYDLEMEHNQNLADIESGRDAHRRNAWEKYTDAIEKNKQEWEKYWDAQKKAMQDWLALRDQEMQIAEKLHDMGLINEQQLAAYRQRYAQIQWANMHRQGLTQQEYYEAEMKYLDAISAGQEKTQDKFQELIGQVIGAPQEMIRKFLSPAAIQQRFGRGIMATGIMNQGLTATLTGTSPTKISIDVNLHAAPELQGKFTQDVIDRLGPLITRDLMTILR